MKLASWRRKAAKPVPTAPVVVSTNGTHPAPVALMSAPAGQPPVASEEGRKRRTPHAPDARIKRGTKVHAVFLEQGEDPRLGLWPVGGAKPSWLWGNQAYLVRADPQGPERDSCNILPDAGHGWRYLTRDWVFDRSLSAPMVAETCDVAEELTEDEMQGEEAEEEPKRHPEPAKSTTRRAFVQNLSTFRYTSENVPTPRLLFAQSRFTRLSAITDDGRASLLSDTLKATLMWLAIILVLAVVLLALFGNQAANSVEHAGATPTPTLTPTPAGTEVVP